MTERGAAAGWLSTLSLSLLGAASSTFWAGALGAAIIVLAMAQSGRAEAGSYERTFHQPKSAVEKALKELQPALSGRLPVLDGFALTGDHPLNHYQRAYYQTAVQVSSSASGDSVVRASTKVTAWYADSNPSHSGYQLLISNGRLESDLLDQLADLLASKPNTSNPTVASANKRGTMGKSADEPAISAPVPQPQEKEKSPEPGRGLHRPWSRVSHLRVQRTTKLRQKLPAQTSLQAEAAAPGGGAQEPGASKELVAVKKSGTPIVSSPSLTGKTLFLASAHDEFEMLDFDADWVHVRISGLSRGWIWRTSLEMPEGISRRSAGQRRGRAGCGRSVSGVARRNSALPWRLGATARKERENYLGAKDSGKRRETAARKRNWNMPSRCSTRTTRNWRENPRTGGGCIDFRFRRWGHDCRHFAYCPAMEGGDVIRRRSLASMLFRSARNIQRFESGRWSLVLSVSVGHAVVGEIYRR